MAVNKLSLPAKENAVQNKINEIIDNLGGGGGGTATDVQINGTSITSNNVANIVTNTAYNASSNKIATMSDVDNVATGLNGKANTDLSNCTKPYVIDSYENSGSGYVKYSNGICYQWGSATVNSTTSNYEISLLTDYASASSYSILTTVERDAAWSSNTGGANYNALVSNAGTLAGKTTRTKSKFHIAMFGTGVTIFWFTVGKV